MRRGQPAADPLQAVLGLLYPVRLGVQRVAQQILEVIMAVGRELGWLMLAHVSRPSTSRNAAIPRAIWLLTAPRLIPIAEAISASDSSA